MNPNKIDPDPNSPIHLETFDYPTAPLTRSTSRALTATSDLISYESSSIKSDSLRTDPSSSSLSKIAESFAKPFKQFESLENVNWTQQFPSPIEDQYRAFRLKRDRKNFHMLALFWSAFLVCVWLFLEFRPFTRIMQTDPSVLRLLTDPTNLLGLRLSLGIGLGMTLLLVILHLDACFGQYNWVFCIFLAVIVLSTSICLHVFTEVGITCPNLFIFIASVSIFSILSLNFVVNISIAVGAIIATIVFAVVNGYNDPPLIVAQILVVVTCVIWGVFFAYVRELYERSVYLKTVKLARIQRDITAESNKSQQLLTSILPRKLVQQLSTMVRGSREQIDPIELVRKLNMQYEEQVTVLFADMVGFTELSSTLPPERLVGILNAVFTEFDYLAAKYSVEKIKTLGDCYMACAGVPVSITRQADRVVLMALEMIHSLRKLSRRLNVQLLLRIGIHTGDVYAGVLGGSKFSYDVWSDDVLIASKMESTGLPNRIQISQATASSLTLPIQLVAGEIRDLGGVLGKLQTYFVDDVYDIQRVNAFLGRNEPRWMTAATMSTVPITPTSPMSPVSPMSPLSKQSLGSFIPTGVPITADEEQPIEVLVMEVAELAEREAKRQMNPVLLTFRDDTLEMTFNHEKIFLCFGNFSVIMVITYLCFLLQSIMERVIVVRDWTLWVSVIALPVLLVVVILSICAFISTKDYPPGLLGRCAHKIGKAIHPYFEAHLVMIFTLSVMFIDALLDMANWQRSGFIVADVLLVTMCTTGFYRLKSFYRNILAISFLMVFLLIVGLAYQETFSFDILVPVALCLLVSVCYNNIRMESIVRLNYLMKRTLLSLLVQVSSLKDETDYLLYQILPPPIVLRLKQSPGRVVADRFENMAVLFATIANFAAFRRTRSNMEEIVATLNEILCEFDSICFAHNVQKIKTNGPTYMAIAGLHREDARHTASCLAALALDFEACVQRLNIKFEFPFEIRIGINVGPCVTGVLGQKKYSFDIWGDTVNVASRMESTSEVNRIQVPASIYELLKDDFDLDCRGPIQVKGKGEMVTYYLVGKRPLSFA